jgi:hypothetical protein
MRIARRVVYLPRGSSSLVPATVIPWGIGRQIQRQRVQDILRRYQGSIAFWEVEDTYATTERVGSYSMQPACLPSPFATHEVG